MAKKQQNDTELDIVEVKRGRLKVRVVGTSPLIFNTMSEKVKRGLLFPQKSTALTRAANMKHNPLEEYRSSMLRASSDDMPTAIALLAAAFKRAMATAALDLPGARKAVIGRLTTVEGEQVSIYGVPALRMDVVRMADIARTPDIRTRACIAKWAAELSVTFVQPQLTSTAVARLLIAAGVFVGVGDGRQEKGALNFGAFRLANEEDMEFNEIVATGGKAAQRAAIERPEAYDGETLALLTWFEQEVEARAAEGQANAISAKKKRAERTGGAA